MARPPFTLTGSHDRYMRQALEAAEKAFLEGEVPVGAVLVCDETLSFTAHNLRESRKDPTAHAEILVLQEGARKLGRWRLGGTLYSTLEPCVMCAGALVQARIDRLVYGASDPKAGGCGSVVDVVRDLRFNHRIEVRGGLFSEASTKLLQAFFKHLR
ncbi:MAG: tRNA adenosine(34) deaminase TadA [Nitrospiria bacterium]